MGLQQSKDELVFQQVNYGNIEGIKSLRAEGAGLEWIDREGKTPLILACMNPELYNVAKTLIELGANVNAYRPGLHAGTPLHHAAKRGNEHIVKLLLSHGANALVMNDSCQTALDVARFKGYSNVVRTIESHICLFSGWLQELYGPGFLELLAPQLLSRKVWAVVLPCGSRKPSKPFKLELAIYSSSQDAQPRTTIALWKAHMDDTNLNRPDPAVIITCSNKSRIKLSCVNASEKQQLERFCNACKGIPQAVVPAFPFNTQGSIIEATAPPVAEDVELAFAISASLHSVAQERHMDVNHSPGSNASCSYTDSTSHNVSNNASNCEIQEVGSSSNPIQHDQTNSNTNPVDGSNISSIVSAPPISDMIINEGPIHYPSIDSSPVDLSLCSAVGEDNLPAKNDQKRDDNADSSSCVICLDAPIEGACVPCGHMAGCMSCLNEIKAKKWGCPVCRSKIDQVIRVYAV